MSRSCRGLLVSTFVFGLLSSAPRRAEARPGFINWLRDYVVDSSGGTSPLATATIGLPLCHTGARSDRAEFLDRPFTRSLRAESDYAVLTLTAASYEKFVSALRGLDEQKIDSDCDGYSDLDELRADSDPNSPLVHPRDEPTVGATCASPPLTPPGPNAGGGSGGAGGSDDGNEKGSRNGPPAAVPPPAASSCAVSSPARPLDADALGCAALVFSSLTFRMARSRRRRRP